VEGERTYRDGVDITATEFHERLRDGGELPTTSQPTPAAFLETYARAFEEAETVVAVLVSSTLSGTLAAGRGGGRASGGRTVHVVDSLGASSARGHAGAQGGRAGRAGHAAGGHRGGAEERAGELGDRLHARTTLDRLVASGRVTRSQAIVGRALALRPILGLHPDGRVDASARPLGTQGALGQAAPRRSRHIPAHAEHVRFGIVHVGVPEVAEQIARELRAEYGEHVDILRTGHAR
jgi:DegV family protein with EDD domain